MQWGHARPCECSLCLAIQRVHLLVAKGTALPGFVDFASSKVRTLEGELRDALSRKGTPEEKLPAPPGYFKEFPGQIRFDAKVPAPPPLPEQASQVSQGSGQPSSNIAETSTSTSTEPAKAREPLEKNSQSLQTSRVVDSLAALRAFPKSHGPRQPSEISPGPVKKEAYENSKESKGPVAEVTGEESDPAVDRPKRSRPKKRREESSSPKRRRSRSKGRKRSPSRKPRRSRSSKRSKGARSAPREEEGGKEKKYRGEKPPEPDHPPPGRNQGRESRPQLPRRANNSSGASSSRAGRGWIGPLPDPRHYKTWGKNKGIVKRAKQARHQERRARHGA